MKKIMIVAGEPSGDVHGAELIHACKKIDSTLYFYGMGGQHMRAASAEILIDNCAQAVIGVTEVVKHLPQIYRNFKFLKKHLQTNPPDLLILVDYPEFNLRLAKVAKKYGIKTLYYISPTVWAWRSGRVHIIKKCVNKIAVIFPFEKKFYQQHQVPVAYVGNPAMSLVKTTLSSEEALSAFQLEPHKKIIGLLPGSRAGEIKYLLPVMLAAAQLLKQRYADLQFVLPLAHNIAEQDLAPYLHQFPYPVRIIKDQTYNAIGICHAIVATSGTVTLEVALLKIPLLIIYKLSWLTYCIGKLLVKTKLIGLCNIMANKKIAQEFIQRAANPRAIMQEISKILDDQFYREQMIRDFQRVQEAFYDQTQKEEIGCVVMDLIS